MKKTKVRDRKKGFADHELDYFLSSNPSVAATELDAILFFIHSKYSGKSSLGSIPNLGTFPPHKADVVFSDEVKHVTIEKSPEKPILVILAPPVPEDEEEDRRIFLLDKFGELLIKCQKQAYMQIRQMLLGMLDENGRKTLVEEFEKFREKNQLQSNNEGAQ